MAKMFRNARIFVLMLFAYGFFLTVSGYAKAGVCNIAIHIEEDDPVMKVNLPYELSLKITNLSRYEISVPTGWGAMGDYIARINAPDGKNVYLAAIYAGGTQNSLLAPSESITETYELSDARALYGASFRFTPGEYHITLIRRGPITSRPYLSERRSNCETFSNILTLMVSE